MANTRKRKAAETEVEDNNSAGDADSQTGQPEEVDQVQTQASVQELETRVQQQDAMSNRIERKI